MAVILRKLEGPELPDIYKSKRASVAFQVTAENGEVYYLDSDEDAAALVARLHARDLQDKAAN